jgi:hypothetical protein
LIKILTSIIEIAKKEFENKPHQKIVSHCIDLLHIIMIEKNPNFGKEELLPLSTISNLYFKYDKDQVKQLKVWFIDSLNNIKIMKVHEKLIASYPKQCEICRRVIKENVIEKYP